MRPARPGTKGPGREQVRVAAKVDAGGSHPQATLHAERQEQGTDEVANGRKKERIKERKNWRERGRKEEKESCGRRRERGTRAGAAFPGTSTPAVSSA